jgi:acetyl-CoA acetyltransferase
MTRGTGAFGRGTAIVGIGETRLEKRPGRSGLELQAEAVMAALADAGLGRNDVDALFNLAPYSQPAQMFGMTLAEYMGIRPTAEASIDAGGTWSTMLMVANCIWAVQSGQSKVAVATFGEAGLTGKPVAGHGWTTTLDLPQYELPFGISGAVMGYALLASRRIAECGATEAGLGAIAVSARRHASMNENAYRRTPFTLDEYFDSRMVSTPLRLLDCSTMVDGAGAIVVTSLDRAHDMATSAVEVRGVASYMSHRDVGQFRSFDDLHVAEVGRRALEQADLKLADVDVAEIHDAFTISTLVYLEELGVCGRGEGSDYALAGGLDLGGPLPINTHGGLLSQGHVAGLLHVTEAVKQLRGDCGTRQVPGAEVALVAGGGGMFGVNAVMVLGRA